MAKSNKPSGIRGIKGINSIAKGAPCQSKKSEYLDLYMLNKEKYRLEQELLAIDSRKIDIQKRIVNINNQIARLQDIEDRKSEATKKEVIESNEKVWKKIKMSY